MKVFDLHCDTLSELRRAEMRGDGQTFAHNNGHIDLEKLEKGETAESSSSGIGMANVRQRLKLIYGDKSSISFRNRTAGGVKVTIEIPFTYSEPDSLWELEQMDDWSDLDELW